MRVRVVVVGFVALAVLGVVPVSAQEVFVVDDSGDGADPQRGDGVCGAPCTLRAAIQEANALPGVQEIHFAVRGPIRPLASELQVNMDAVVIDGTTHPDYAGTPVVELDGSAMTTSGSGLSIHGSAAGSTIRGLAVHSFPGRGILLAHDGREEGGPSLIEGNHLGTDPSGTQARPNGRSGLEVFGLFGGRAGRIVGNVVSGNATYGIDVISEGVGLVIEGNRIGTDVTGSADLGNGDAGIRLNAGGVSVVGNLVSGNGDEAGPEDAGITISEVADEPNVVVGNLVGTDAGGGVPVPNAADGVYVRGGGNRIGGRGAGEANTIAFNGRNGVCVASVRGVDVSGNAIHSNGLLGIDLDQLGSCDGTVAENDPGDEPNPVRGNEVQNYPVPAGAGTWSLDSTPSTTFRIDGYANDTCDPSGHGEGQRFVQALDVTTDAAGQAAFGVTAAGGVITLTATDPDGNTSEFSPCSAGGAAGAVERVGAAASSDVRDIAIGISQFLFETAAEGSARTQQGARARSVILGRNDVFADALAGAPLAGDHSPILYTTGGAAAPLDAATRAEIDRVLSPGGKVTILGGSAALSAAVEAELIGAGYTVERLFGGSRYETAAVIARTVLTANPGKTEALLAYGGNFPDAVTGGAYGARFATPILLTDTGELHPATRQVMAEFEIKTTFVLGGTAVVSEAAAAQAPGAQRIAGPNRMATAAAIASQLWGTDGKNAVVVNLERDDAWAVSLSAAVLSARVEGPQVGVGAQRLPAESAGVLDALPAGAKGYVAGTVEFVGDDVAAEVAARL